VKIKVWVRHACMAVLIVVLSGTFLLSGSYAEDSNNGAVTTIICPTEPVKVALNQKKLISTLFNFADSYTYSTQDSKIARVTAQGLLIPLKKGTTNVQVNGEGAASKGAISEAIVEVGCTISLQVVDPIANKPLFTPRSELRKVKVGRKSFTVQTVLMPKGYPVDVGLANNKVGAVDSLKTIAEKFKADFAINGTYFEAYGGIPEPWGTLIKDGEAAHITLMGTSIGFTADGTAKMDTLRLKIEGGMEGSYQYPSNWYATFVNRTPTAEGSSSVLFTPARGSRIGFAYGLAITVKAGIVMKITENEDVLIPSDGFVIVMTGSTRRSMEKKFEVGKKVYYRLKYENMDGNSIDWKDVVTAVGAGPRVLVDGKVSIQAEKEGFTQAKILTTPAARSGIGIKKDGSIILVTVGSATVKELGGILQSLGAVQGMNLDGGASSGLYAKGKLLTTPGRLISNSLVFG
jgi:exopolysaccharide biosynthesis protein